MALAALTLTTPLAVQSVSAAGAGRPQVTLNADGLTLEWRAPAPAFSLDREGTTITLAGYDTLNTPGLPRLPFASVLIALPPQGEASLALEAHEDVTQALPAPLVIAPQPAGAQRNQDGEVIGGAYAAAEALPVAFDVVELEEIGVARGVRLARVTFYPARPEGGGLRVTTRVRATIRFSASLAEHDTQGDGLVETVAAAVVNPTQVQVAWPASAAPGEPQNVVPRALIEVTQTGLTTITYEALTAAGYSLAGADPASVRLRHAGVEVALEWEGDADAMFEPGERFIFFASPRFSRYSTVDVYSLTVENGSGLRMTSRAAVPGGLPAGNAWVEQLFETNALYMPECNCAPLPAGRDGDRWAWEVLRQTDRLTLEVPFALPTVNTTQPATLTTWFIGYTAVAQAPDHRVNVALNNAAPSLAAWDGKEAYTHTVTIPAGGLLNGNNSVRLSLAGGLLIEGAWFDALAIRYARGSAATGNSVLFTGETTQRAYTLYLASANGLRAYDVTEAGAPVRLTDLSGSTFGDPAASLPRRYVVSNAQGLLSPTRVRLAIPPQAVSGARYLVITHPNFTGQLAPLVTLRQAQGLSVVVENVQAIYDAADGRVSPEAIRAYIANAYATWSPRPEYVLLVGDGAADPKRYRAQSFATFIPPYLEVVDPWIGETAADNRYVTVDGADALPDLLLGRLPVNTVAEASAVINKIVPAETAPFVGTWNATVAFVSDNADAAGNFPQLSQALAGTHIAAPFGAQQIVTASPVTPTVQAVLGRWNAGAGLVVYNGHASNHQWTAERIFHIDDVGGLTNVGRYPVALHLTCLTGTFHSPGLTALDEALLVKANGGAVAVWGPSGLGVATGHDVLANAFLGRVYGNGQPEVGAATLAGKLALAAANTAPDLLDTFTLFGDPATRADLTIDPGFPVYLPVIRR
jgi:hypothetical protein